MLNFKNEVGRLYATITAPNQPDVIGCVSNYRNGLVRFGKGTFSLIGGPEKLDTSEEVNLATVKDFQETCRKIHQQMKAGKPPLQNIRKPEGVRFVDEII